MPLSPAALAQLFPQPILRLRAPFNLVPASQSPARLALVLTRAEAESAQTAQLLDRILGPNALNVKPAFTERLLLANPAATNLPWQQLSAPHVLVLGLPDLEPTLGPNQQLHHVPSLRAMLTDPKAKAAGWETMKGFIPQL